MLRISTSRIACLVLVAAVTVLLVHPESVAAAGCTGSGTYTLSGKVRTSSGAGVSGVTMTLSGPGGCTSTTKTGGTRGFYAFFNVRKGTYTLTPSKTGCAFNPPSKAITLSGNTTANFTASCL
ncbi:MAG TPA: carboxypeptidase-like regulatory domain-containing protein [bacterium]|jgi:hypothetical protein